MRRLDNEEWLISDHSQNWAAYGELYKNATRVYTFVTNLSDARVQIYHLSGCMRMRFTLQILHKMDVFQFHRTNSRMVAAIAPWTLLGPPEEEKTIHYFLKGWRELLGELQLHSSNAVHNIEQAQSTLDRLMAEYTELDRKTGEIFEAVKTSCADIDLRRYWWQEPAAVRYKTPCLLSGFFGQTPFFDSNGISANTNRRSECVCDSQPATTKKHTSTSVPTSFRTDKTGAVQAQPKASSQRGRD